MPFYEVTYETGRMSVAFYEDDKEAQSALGAHQERAQNGKAGGPVEHHPKNVPGEPNWSAERIAKVRVYDEHPNEFNPDQTMSSDVLEKEVQVQIKRLADENGVVSIDQLALAVRGISHPMVEGQEHPFDSAFKMKEKREMKLKAVS